MADVTDKTLAFMALVIKSRGSNFRLQNLGEWETDARETLEMFTVSTMMFGGFIGYSGGKTILPW